MYKEAKFLRHCRSHALRLALCCASALTPHGSLTSLCPLLRSPSCSEARAHCVSSYFTKHTAAAQALLPLSNRVPGSFLTPPSLDPCLRCLKSCLPIPSNPIMLTSRI